MDLLVSVDLQHAACTLLKVEVAVQQQAEAC